MKPDNKELFTVDELFKKYSDLRQFEEGDPEYLIDKEDFKSAIHEFGKDMYYALQDVLSQFEKKEELPAEYVSLSFKIKAILNKANPQQ